MHNGNYNQFIKNKLAELKQWTKNICQNAVYMRLCLSKALAGFSDFFLNIIVIFIILLQQVLCSVVQNQSICVSPQTRTKYSKLALWENC